MSGDGSPGHGISVAWRVPMLFIHFGWLREVGSRCDTSRIHQLSIVLALTSVVLFTTSVFGQSPAINSTDKRIPVADKKVAADEPKPKDLQSEVDAMKAENAAVRELLRKMEEQQKTLLEQVDRLQRRLDGARQRMRRSPAIVPPTTGDASATPNARESTASDRFSKYFRTAGARCRNTGKRRAL